MQTEVSPSILAADFACLEKEIAKADQAGADFFHLDVMDGHFVPNFSMGPAVVSAVRRCTQKPLEVHLMVYNPFEYIEVFASCGIQRVIFHLEATEDVEETLDYIHRCGMQAGLAINPETSPTFLLKYLEKCDQILLMTVNPGFGGQAFIPSVLDKIRFLRDTCKELKIGVRAQEGDSIVPFRIEVDGGIDERSGLQCREAGANILVAGTYLFRSNEMKERIATLRTS